MSIAAPVDLPLPRPNWATRTRCGAISSIACIGLSTIRLRGLFVVTTILNHLSVLGHLGRFIHHSREINGAPFCQLLQYRPIRWRQSDLVDVRLESSEVRWIRIILVHAHYFSSGAGPGYPVGFARSDE